MCKIVKYDMIDEAEKVVLERGVEAAVVDAMTGDEFCCRVKRVLEAGDVEAARGLGEYFGGHPFEFDLSLLRMLFVFYEGENGIDMAVREQMSLVVLEILRWHEQNVSVIEFVIENGFHFLVWNWFPELFTIEVLRELIPVSVEVLRFVLENQIIARIMASLGSDDEQFVCRMIDLVSAFRRYASTYVILGPLLSRICTTAVGAIGKPRCVRGLCVLGQFAHTSQRIAASVMSNSEFQKSLLACAELHEMVPCFVRFFEEALITPFHTLGSELSRELVHDLAVFLCGALSLSDGATVAASARILRDIVVDSERMCICWEAHCLERLIIVLQSNQDFSTAQTAFECLCHFISFSNMPQLEFIISHGFFEFLHIYIDSVLADNEVETLEWVFSFERICIANKKSEWLSQLFSCSPITDAVLAGDDISESVRDRINGYIND